MSTVTSGKVHIGDVGTEFQSEILETDINGVTTPMDLTGKTTEMTFTDPAGAETTFSATIFGPPVDGIITFTNTDEDFFNESGYWFYRATVIDGPNSFTSNSVGFEVLGQQQ